MSALEYFIKNVAERKGLRRMEAMRRLRWYINKCTPEEFRLAVNRITNYQYLKILVEAGLTRDKLEYVTRRADQLARRRERR